ncbi:MAG TPA: ABC transporter permease, partial [Flavisolibacter sp.]|nr:ABC transporter permease [Flavisolibacter sp.]
MNLLVSLRSEVLKNKRTAALYLTLIAAAFGPFMSLLDVLLGEGVAADDRAIIFNKLMTVKFQMTGLAIFPIFLILICTLLPQIEFKNNAWKQVLASPQTKSNIF